jgi:1,4-alpha-glucan branching enzyme
MRMRWLIVSMLIATGACAPPLWLSPPVVTAGGVRFAVAHASARMVALAGSFNGWSTSAHPLTLERQRGLWTVLVELPPGEHQFMYVVDGTEWISPPFAEDYADDGFGSRNGIVVVRPGAP